MSRRQWIMLLALAAIWGASFMFIKIAVRELEPATVVFWRVGLGALGLVAIAPLVVGGRELVSQLRRYAGPLVLIGILNAVIPFWFLSWSETRIDSGLAAVLQASTPLFAALLALRFSHSDRVTGLRLAGVLVGFVGVAVLVGAQPKGDAVAALAVLVTALCYAAAALYGGRRLSQLPPLTVAFGTMLAATIVSAPIGLLQTPDSMPGWKPLAAVAVLGFAGLSVAYVLYFALIAGAGASRAVLVTYLVPAIALAYGVAFLSEPLTWSALAGLLLILGGVALGSGALRGRRARVASEVPL
jgi:drug/metabolite transporter (DMT)-like permease